MNKDDYIAVRVS